MTKTMSDIYPDSQKKTLKRLFYFRNTAKYYAGEKEEPQPHVVCAFGLRITNCEPCKSSL